MELLLMAQIKTNTVFLCNVDTPKFILLGGSFYALDFQCERTQILHLWNEFLTCLLTESYEVMEVEF